MTNNPDADFNVAFERPVEQPSILGSLAGLANSYAKSRNTGGPTAAETNRADGRRRMVGLEDGLRKAEAVRKQKGVKAGLKLERQVMRNFALDGGDLSDGAVGEIYTNVTGRDADFAGLSAEEIAVNDFRKSNDYSSFVLAAKYQLPEGTSLEELENYAITQKARQASLELTIQNTEIDWVQGGRQQAFSEVISNFRNTSMGALQQIVEEGGTITREDILSAQSQWASLKATLESGRPSGLEAGQWQPIADRMSTMDQTLEFLKTVSGTQGVTGKVMSDLAQGIQIAVDNGDISDLEGAAVLKAIERDPLGAITEFGVTNPTRISDILAAQNRTTVPTEGSTDPSVVEQYKGVDAETTFKDAENIVESSGSLKGSPELLGGAYEQAFGAMSSLGDNHNQFVSVSGVNKVFNGSVVKGLELIGQQNPERASQLADQASQALDSQMAVAASALTAIESRGIFTFDRETNKPVISNESLTRLGWTASNVSLMENMANEYYNGDLVALLQDKGSRFRQQPKNQQEALAGSLARGFPMSGVEASRKELVAQGQLVQRLGELRNQFNGLSDSFIDKEPEAPIEREPTISSSNFTGGVLGGNGPIAQNLGIDFDSIEKDSGLPTGYLETMAFIESGGNPAAKNPNSSAGGLFQQIDANAKAYNVADRFDPAQSTEGAVRFAVENKNRFEKRMGRAPQGWELYVMHQQGGGGGMKLFSAPDDSANAVSVLGKDQVLLNGGDAETTVGGFKKIWQNKYNRVANSRGFSDEPIRPMDKGQGNDTISLPQREEVQNNFTPTIEEVASSSVPEVTDVAQGNPINESPRPVERTEKVKQTVLKLAETDRLSAETRAFLERLGVEIN